MMTMHFVAAMPTVVVPRAEARTIQARTPCEFLPLLLHRFRNALMGFIAVIALLLFSSFANAAVVFNEDFDGPALDPDKWQTSFLGGGAVLSFSQGQLVATLVGGSNGFFGIADGIFFTPKNVALAGDYEVSLKASELFKAQVGGYHDYTFVQLSLGSKSLVIAGDYAGYAVPPYGGYFGHRVAAYDGSSGVYDYCLFDDSLSPSALYTVEFRVRRTAGNLSVGYRLEGRSWVDTACGTQSGTVSPNILVWTGDGGGTYQNAQFTAALDYFRVADETPPTVTPTTATLDQPTTFTVTGNSLAPGLGFALSDCTPADSEVFDGTTSNTLRKFQCTPRGSTGLKYGRVKSSPNGPTLANFTVDVVANLGANEVASFVFDGPISDQQTGQPFSVRVRAVNSNGTTVGGFNGSVRLSRLPSATLSRSTLQFASGEWSGQTAVLTSGQGKLTAEYLRSDRVTVYGSSSAFEVSSAAARQTFTVTGRTLPTVDEVRLTNETTSATLTTQVDTDGKFVFSNVPKGRHRVQVLKSGFRQITQKDPFDVAKDLTLPTIQVTDGSRYVLLVPGMMESTLKNSVGAVNREDVFGLWFEAPVLPKDNRCTEDKALDVIDSLTLYDPLIGLGNVKGHDGYALGWRKVAAALKARGFMVYQVPWDWRCTAKQAADAYLAPAIRKLRQIDPTAEVSLVAHSMGGLVAREYIQSDGYGGEVSNFVMLGTPNAGATKAYYLMEGGDPKRADDGIPIYLNAIESLHKTMMDSGLTGKSNTYVREFIRSNVVGGYDLLPVYPFLRLGQLQTEYSAAVQGYVVRCAPNAGATIESVPDNRSLTTLNAKPTLDRFVAFDQTPTTLQVRTKLFLSNEKNTDYIITYCSKGKAGTAYGQGIPDTVSEDIGDSTVRAALGLAFNGSMRQEGKYGTHPYMVGALAENVAALLAGSSNKSISSTSTATRTQAQLFASQIQFRGGPEINMELQLPDGLTTGTSEQGVVTELAGRSEVVNFSQTRAINIVDPVAGSYLLTVRSAGNIARTLQTVDVTFGSESKTGSVSVRFLASESPKVLPLDLTPNAIAPVIAINLTKAPVALTASRGANGVVLSWVTPPDSTVTGYRVFVRENSKSVYQLTAETSNTLLLTNYPWATSDEDLLHFVVLGVNAAGKESWVSEANYVTNRSFVAADFTSSSGSQSLDSGTPLPVTVSFTDLSTSSAPIVGWEWDFNGDGLPDSTEQNPSFAFSSYGKHTVSLTVTSDDGADTRVQAFAINVAPCAPLQQSASCSLDANGDGRVDARDGLLILRRMLGFSGSALTDGVVNASCGTAATQSTIAAFVDNQIAGGYYNLDGSPSGTSVTSSGLIIYRALQGLTDSGVTANTLRPDATRTTWAGAGQIRDYLNAQCGAGL